MSKQSQDRFSVLGKTDQAGPVGLAVAYRRIAYDYAARDAILSRVLQERLLSLRRTLAATAGIGGLVAFAADAGNGGVAPSETPQATPPNTPQGAPGQSGGGSNCCGDMLTSCCIGALCGGCG